jgi:hypothetical protein
MSDETFMCLKIVFNTESSAFHPGLWSRYTKAPTLTLTP